MNESIIDLGGSSQTEMTPIPQNALPKTTSICALLGERISNDDSTNSFTVNIICVKFLEQCSRTKPPHPTNNHHIMLWLNPSKRGMTRKQGKKVVNLIILPFSFFKTYSFENSNLLKQLLQPQRQHIPPNDV
jgi:hypothetical protein